MEVKARLLWCWWWWWLLVSLNALTGLARAQTPCVPKLVVEGASENPQRPWKFAFWQRVQLRVTPVPSRECPIVPLALEYCWQLHHRQGDGAPQPVPCDEMARCEDDGPSLDHAPYTLTRANYTVQVMARLPDSLLPHRCLTAYFVIPPTPTFPLYFHRGPRIGLPLHRNKTRFLEGGSDPDKDPHDLNNVMDLRLILKCKDARGFYDCRNLYSTPTRTRFYDKKALVYLKYTSTSPVISNYLFNYTASAKEKVWPYRTAEPLQGTVFLKTGPVPEVIVVCAQCSSQRLLSTDTLEMKVICWEGLCIKDVPIHCTWLVEQEGIGPLDLTIHTKERKASGVDMRKLTILPGAFQPGSDFRVRVRVHYAPSTEQQISAYKQVVDEYREFQSTRP